MSESWFKKNGFYIIDSMEQGKNNGLEIFVWRKLAKDGKLTFLFEVGGSVMGWDRSRSQVGARGQ